MVSKVLTVSLKQVIIEFSVYTDFVASIQLLMKSINQDYKMLWDNMTAEITRKHIEIQSVQPDEQGQNNIPRSILSTGDN